MGIDTVNLGHIDLNLLVHLGALLTERSVTRAAARVGIGQSAMSHNLARLRELFSDELLTRGPEGMRLTPRAVTLLEPVQSMLAQVEALVSREQTFDPATAVRTFTFGLPDSMEILFMPALLARMRDVAPGIHLRLYNFDASRLLDDLDADEMDLAIGYDAFQQGQLHHKRRKLFTESYVCMFNAGLTGITPPISLDDYVRLPHVLTSLRPARNARGIVDEALEKLGLRRSVALTTPRFLTAPSLVAHAPVIVTIQARLARRFAADFGLSLSPLPIELREVTVSLLWHTSYDHDPAHSWLREQVAQLATEL
ncbi:LysR family transcriptional regulator [Bradyrhizobium sp. WSM471]|uniref:LysR family transcriptional regulator n=1 Tax=Bradyrhizobium sp. WSM471 TaxID=319017 RepID=UPI00024D2C5C|nr:MULTISPECIES: LysR family transcriptional regulator [Bradyrhizobium]EHR03141.1 transcriptional regulator [Bradyrhizobium sp. WSM471]UFW38376.1 LysR family transcriptional regulator [Bradyrhizobium canariense]